jgi:hypothetical protein
MLVSRERRQRRLRELFSLPRPRRRDVATAAAAVAVLPALLAVAAAQPVLVHRHSVLQRADTQAFIVFDTSLSMSARPTPGAPTRLDRAKREADALVSRLGDIPVGIATMTDRVLPTLMPTTDTALARQTIAQSVAINEPPPSQLYHGRATNLQALLPIPSYRLFTAVPQHSILVVYTDGESGALPSGVGYDLVQQLTIRPLFVHVWRPTERVYIGGRPDPFYRIDHATGFVLHQFARDTRGRVFGEHQLGALLRTIRMEAGKARADKTIYGYGRFPLGPWVLLAGVFPLGFLFWRRNL